MVSQAPYGTWISPIAADFAASDSITIEEILVDPVSSRVYHLEKRPSQGRNVLVDTENNCDIFGLGWNARSGVHEYGGAAATVHDGVAYFSHWTDGRLYRVKGKESPEAITPENANHRYANFEVHPVHTHLLVAVLEDHTFPDPRNVVNCVCLINTLSGSVDKLVAGADFYAGLKFSPDGTRMAWKQWFHPQMPWDGSELHIGEIAFFVVSEQPAHSLTCENVIHIAGNEQTSVSFPSWANNDVLVFTSNESGYLNPWKYVISSCKASPVLHAPYPFDFGSASALGDSPYAFTDPSGTGAMFSVFISGRSSLSYVSIESGAPPLELTSRKQYAVIQNIRQLHAQPSSIVFLGKLAHRPPRIVVCSANISSAGELVEKPLFNPMKIITSSIPMDFNIALPAPITLYITPEQPLHIVYFIPTNAQYSGSSVPYERPPSIVSIHGGPTKMAAQDFDWTKQFFTSRGWAYDQLKGNWGITDVQDAVFAAKALSRAPYSLIDPDRIVIRGASAGGFTALAALSDSTNATFFAAGTSLYGISDFRRLAQLSHKYELMYLDGLLGGKLEEIPQVYADRSPISHADNIVQPLLIMQGSIDKVVPKLQSDMIVESVERRGGHVQYKLFEGEGHGFRKAVNIRDALETELGFYAKVLAIPIKQ